MITEFEKQFEKLDVGTTDYDEYPSTISKSWMDIALMKELYPYNQDFLKNLDSLEKSDHIFAWKRSRGDGNCYFRAVISSFFLMICKPYSKIDLLVKFNSLVYNLQLEDTISEYSSSKDKVLLELSSLYQLKSQGNHLKVFETALNLIQDKDFDQDLIRISRLITYNQLLLSKDSEEYSFYFIDGIDFIIYDILEMGREGGDFSLIFLPKGLEIQVIQYMFYDKPETSIQKFPEIVPPNSLKVHIMRRQNHYDILGPIQEVELDMYLFSKGIFHFSSYPDYYSRFVQKIQQTISTN
jgi:hypothetical protein